MIYYTYTCRGTTCSHKDQGPHPILMEISEFDGCKFMPVFSSKEEAIAALTEAGFSLDRLREIEIKELL